MENEIEKLVAEHMTFRADVLLKFKGDPQKAYTAIRDNLTLLLTVNAQALAASQESERKLREALNTPEVEDFDAAIPLEAAHQVQRWSAEHDAGKTPEDWFWLIGYLAGKALHSAKSCRRCRARSTSTIQGGELRDGEEKSNRGHAARMYF